MNDGQRNKLRMYGTVRTYLTLNGGVWSGIPANADAHASLAARIAVIDTKVRAQGAELEGYTNNKGRLRASLHTKTLLVGDAAAAYARASSNPILLADVDLAERDLANASDQNIGGVAKRVHAAANGVLAALGDYGITAADLTDLQNAITAHGNAKSLPDVRRAMRSGHTKALGPLFTATSEFLDGQLDKLMRRYKAENPAFHAGYKAARVIIDLRGRGGGGDDPEPEPES